ncbi:MAG TPA: MotE family protein [Methylocella sp.]|nr:MotE family protein [Methylocella sp.]
MQGRITLAIALCALGLGSAILGALAQPTKAPNKAALDAAPGNDVALYCANVAPAVAEVRLARQIKRLNELETEVKLRVRELEQKEAEAREWVGNRQAILKKASDVVVAIFSKMDPEAAAPRLAMMDDETAVAILAKLTPKAAGAILNEMEASRVGRLTGLLSGAGMAAKRS